ncbi:MAG: hypothetical protein RJA57_1286 [Bacteroidota bacterium]|jgi:hypothetical protein
MSDLRTMQLPAFLAADLYPDSLVVFPTQTPPPTPETQSPSSFRYLGSNAKQVTVIVQNETLPFLPDPDLLFLSKILEACKLGLQDVAVVNLKAAGVTIDHDLLKRELRHRNVLLFGASADDIGLPIRFPPFQVQAFDGVTYLEAPALPDVQRDRAVKTRLWNALKTLFPS